MTKNIALIGATGLIGTNLAKFFNQHGYRIGIFGGSVEKSQKIIPFADEYYKWDYKNLDELAEGLEGADIVIHLAGANVFGKRWTDEYKKEIYNSRIDSTRNVVATFNKLKKKPELFICSSGSGYYGNRGDKVLTEYSSNGNDFLARVCRDWEAEAAKAEELNIRRVSIRTAVVFSKDGGALEKLVMPFKFYAGGSLGSGTQYMPWIHIDDLVSINNFVIENENLKGPINAGAPDIVTMKELADKIGKVLHRPSFFKVPQFALNIVLGEYAEAITGSQRMVPQKLLNNNFVFKYPKLEEALKVLLK